MVRKTTDFTMFRQRCLDQPSSQLSRKRKGDNKIRLFYPDQVVLMGLYVPLVSQC